MSDYITRVTEEHYLTSEKEAAELIEKAKKDSRFTLLKSSTEYKPIKEKKEIVDEMWKTTLVKVFNDDWKNPVATIKIDYTIDHGAFPDPVLKEDEDEEDEF